MNAEFLSLIDTIVRDRGIDREVLIQAIEGALAKGISKEGAEVTVEIDRTTGAMKVTAADGTQLPAAQFSRIGAQMAKQLIMQKIREAERDVIFTEFQDQIGDLLSGTVHRFERGDIVVDLGRTEGILPKSERIPHEDYQQGDRIQAYVLDVRKGAKGTEVVLSRAHEGFIRGVFALEVPEINDGIVEIQGVAREAGDRTKIAVSSKDDKVDCVGACVGVRGTRVKNIVRELRGEKVDIIRWHQDVREFLASALAPAKIADIQLDEANKRGLVIVDDDQLSLAIGKKGQNVRLASKLTGWQLDIKSRSQLGASTLELSHIAGVGPTMEARLKEGNVTSVQQLAESTVEQLTAIKGIGDKTAEKLIEAAKSAIAKFAEQAAAPAEPAAAPAPESAPELSAGEPPSEAAESTPQPEAPVEESSEPASPSETEPSESSPPASDKPKPTAPQQPEEQAEGQA